MSHALKYAKNLIARPSITPEDAGCQEWIASVLAPLGFDNEPMPFGRVQNLWSRRGHRANKPLFSFAGHTDVVPMGDQSYWQSPPFEPTEKDGQLYGRGAADMKSSIAAMMAAVEVFLAQTPQPNFDMAFLLTSDEEGPAIDGTKKVIDALDARGEQITWCLIGEPTATNQVGDVVKNGRRGSLSGRLKIIGVQGHIAYPHLAKNPIHLALAALNELVDKKWDIGNDSFPPTTMQLSSAQAGAGADNVTPADMKLKFNFRFSTESTVDGLKAQVADVLDAHGLDYHLEWSLSGEPFLTQAGDLITAAEHAIKKTTGILTEFSTSGGTSDGRFIAPSGAQVLELGPVNASIHQANEHIDIAELDRLTEIYVELLNYLHSHCA